MGTAGPRILLGDMKKLFTGLAVVGGRAYVSVSTENRLAVINVVTGAPEADIPLPHPGRVARQDATHLLAISNQSVVRIDLATNTITPFLTNLTAPSAITADNHGNIYIAECGTKQQITQFDAEGKPLRTYGKPGGRAATVLKYDPLEFRNIVDLTDRRRRLHLVCGKRMDRPAANRLRQHRRAMGARLLRAGLLLIRHGGGLG